MEMSVEPNRSQLFLVRLCMDDGDGRGGGDGPESEVTGLYTARRPNNR